MDSEADSCSGFLHRRYGLEIARLEVSFCRRVYISSPSFLRPLNLRFIYSSGRSSTSQEGSRQRETRNRLGSCYRGHQGQFDFLFESFLPAHHSSVPHLRDLNFVRSSFSEPFLDPPLLSSTSQEGQRPHLPRSRPFGRRTCLDPRSSHGQARLTEGGRG